MANNAYLLIEWRLFGIEEKFSHRLVWQQARGAGNIFQLQNQIAQELHLSTKANAKIKDVVQ